MEYDAPRIDSLDNVMGVQPLINNCCHTGDGDKNACASGTGTSGCTLVGGSGHTCTGNGSGDTISSNTCSPHGQT